jgi:alcohol dehydrogenase class IV
MLGPGGPCARRLDTVTVIDATDGFRWQDGERTVRFGRGALADAPSLLDTPYVLLTTPRAADAAPAVASAAERVVEVAPGRVDELAGELLETVGEAPLLVAVGGGRVVDVAKAIAAATAPRRVAAIPTTLSAAEMTRGHRRAAGTRADVPGVRPAIVVNDPALSASQPDDELAASTANALAHAIEGPLTNRVSPVPMLAAQEAARLLAAGWNGPEPDRDALALGALLSGYVIDSTGYGLHHILSQTLVRLGGVGHGQANAAMLPHTLVALRRREPARLEALALAIGADPVDVAADLAARAGATHLAHLGVTPERLDECAAAAAQRPELSMTPPPADEAELRALYDAAL